MAGLHGGIARKHRRAFFPRFGRWASFGPLAVALVMLAFVGQGNAMALEGIRLAGSHLGKVSAGMYGAAYSGLYVGSTLNMVVAINTPLP
jgi:hypothetical protein